MHLSQQEIVIRLLLSVLLGMLFGFERHRRHQAIGRRTYALVCMAACMISIISAYGFTELHESYPANVNINTDPARLMVGVLSGIGFLGAGIIWRNPNGGVKGITSAATILFVAAVGIGCGLGLYFLVLSASAIAYVIIISETIYKRINEKRTAAKTKTAEAPPPDKAEE